MTYGDGVFDLNIADLIDFHKNSGSLATLTAAMHLEGLALLKLKMKS